MTSQLTFDGATQSTNASGIRTQDMTFGSFISSRHDTVGSGLVTGEMVAPSARSRSERARPDDWLANFARNAPLGQPLGLAAR